jgi:hypothetical protein
MSFLIRLARALARAGHSIFDPTIGTHSALRCIDIRNGGQHRF